MLFIQDIFLDKQAWWPKDVFCQNENQNNKKNSREVIKTARIDRPPPKFKTQPCFHAFVIVPYTLYRNNSKKLRLLKGYHISSYQWREWLPVGVRHLKNFSWLSFLSSLDVSATWKPGLPFFVKGFPSYWDHSMLNPFVRKSTCFVYLQSSLFVQSSSSRQRRSLESNEDCVANIYGTYMYTKFVCKVVRVE